MEQGNDAQYLDETGMSAYPDLDYTPSFPWLGRPSAKHDVRHADPNPPAVAVASSFSRAEISSTQPAEAEAYAFETNVFGDQNHASKIPEDISSDPDFHCGDDSDMYAFIIATKSSS